MDEVFENFHSCNSKDLEDFFRYKIDMELERRKIMRRKEKMKRA